MRKTSLLFSFGVIILLAGCSTRPPAANPDFVEQFDLLAKTPPDAVTSVELVGVLSKKTADGKLGDPQVITEPHEIKAIWHSVVNETSKKNKAKVPPVQSPDIIRFNIRHKPPITIDFSVDEASKYFGPNLQKLIEFYKKKSKSADNAPDPKTAPKDPDHSGP
ncbi:MAG: hypothetical protein JST40_07570 [Armatimonadetes bacterium]|nr:hypothetical protein [Armatimonadota bacterium]